MDPQQDYLQGLENEITLTPASTGSRFVNLIIDLIIYYALNFLMGFVLLWIGPIAYYDATAEGSSMEFVFLAIAFFIDFLYYFLAEGITKGKTVGKLITRTRAVSLDGSPLTWKQAALRSIIRYVPFEPLSAFGGYPWHDTWSGTTVIKE